ncbi:MAG: glycerate kinase [Burkholderiaceae bacterium]
MTWQRLLAVLLAVALGAGAWRAGGWQGLALLGSGLVLWGLLYYTRIVTVMKRAANRPVGYVGSAVMLNAKLQAGQPLLHVLALTGALGQRLTESGADPEVYRWSDPGGSQVTAEFKGGKLTHWQLERPAPEAAAEPPGEA